MLREYEHNGSRWLFDDTDVPDGAVEVKSVTPSNKGRTPVNKQVRPRNK